MPFLREKNGTLSPHKLIAFTGACLPALYLLGLAINQDLGAQPLVELTHQTGEWSVRFLFLSLCITPARRLFNAPKLIFMRRTLGVAAFLYAFAHFLLYVIDQNFALGTVAREIALRLYLTIGFAALVMLTVLGLTSTDGMIRRIGGQRWNKLHRLTYLIAILAVIHFMMQKKLNIYEPTWMAGLLAWLLFYRLVQKRAREIRLPHLIGLVIAATLFTVAAEALWYGLLTGVSWQRVLQANLMFPDAVRPAWVVLFVTAGLTIASAVALWLRPMRNTREKLRAAE
ncbi:MAG: sulfoxide reductase heme-binding subunit YedZ [Xanthobacteraceae bacterium]|nr:sulfoxide reductase heme-binding subunit YedZ [Xanthobacteraceae bacterium]